MSNRSRIVLGSLGGAFAIHLAALACSGTHSIVGSPNASGADGGVQQHDGGFVDVLTRLVDAARDVATNVVDGEVRDAHAGDPPRMMEAPCNVTGMGAFASTFATFDVPGFNPRSAGEVHARVCGYSCSAGSASCASSSAPFTVDCIDQLAYSASGRIAVYCGSSTDHGTTARIWLH